MATRLTTMMYQDKEYYVDYRLNEFRPVNPPLAFIPFTCEQGRDMVKVMLKGVIHNDDDMDSTVPLPRA